MRRRKHRKIDGPVELDITSFMNLMIVLVPVLLINMVFAQTSVLDLNFPTGKASAAELENLQLQVLVRPNELVVSDNRRGVIKAVPMKDGVYDFALLQDVMKDIKSRIPEHKSVTLMPAADTSYQTLVTLMDRVRSYKALVAGSVVEAELFPEISIADAPEAASAGGEGA